MTLALAFALAVPSRAAEPPAVPAPSLELLLHLAEFADAEGRPVDPVEIADALAASPRDGDAATAPDARLPPATAAGRDGAPGRREPPDAERSDDDANR